MIPEVVQYKLPIIDEEEVVGQRNWSLNGQALIKRGFLTSYFMKAFIFSHLYDIASMVLYSRTLALTYSPAAGCVAPPIHVYFRIYFQDGKLQKKLRSPKFPTMHQLTAKTATGNGNLQPEIESYGYSSNKKATGTRVDYYSPIHQALMHA